MDIDLLKLTINLKAINLKDLAFRLKELTFDLECCPETDEICKKLLHLEKLEIEMSETIESMETIKHMSEI